MPANDPELVEVRFWVTRDTFNVLDAISKANRTPKNKLSAAIFDEWADREVHKATLVLRLTKGNGNEAQSDWGDLTE